MIKDHHDCTFRQLDWPVAIKISHISKTSLHDLVFKGGRQG